MKARLPVKLLSILFLSGLILGLAWLYVGNSGYQQAIASSASRYIPALRQPLGQAPSGNLKSELQHAGFKLGQPVLLRIYKQESELEVWLLHGNRYLRFKSYPICKWSGQLGPKLKEGDGQSPEGFYEVAARQLNPNSRYYLAMNIGFPNAFDAAQSRTGSALMIHGSCVSIGCYAMTDAGIDDIYKLVEKALLNNQPSVPVHIFPFRMTEENLKLHANSPWSNFWKNLAEGDILFQKSGRAPEVYACDGRYFYDEAPEDCERVKSW